MYHGSSVKNQDSSVQRTQERSEGLQCTLLYAGYCRIFPCSARRYPSDSESALYSAACFTGTESSMKRSRGVKSQATNSRNSVDVKSEAAVRQLSTRRVELCIA